jgi:hypothetical protein
MCVLKQLLDGLPGVALRGPSPPFHFHFYQKGHSIIYVLACSSLMAFPALRSVYHPTQTMRLSSMSSSVNDVQARLPSLGIAMLRMAAMI